MKVQQPAAVSFASAPAQFLVLSLDNVPIKGSSEKTKAVYSKARQQALASVQEEVAKRNITKAILADSADGVPTLLQKSPLSREVVQELCLQK
ncbi:hypothetical protein ACD591_04785 [Rufibacter glacialis]|uniref:Uncharacterized protein n=1 Tax=Rufibacter glacialis TaxID=1259555 RepID=A0A5M8QF86_9BACT|nr:hypothetical protein [Rufibacter glacialis]KAA6434669.1 hypothetical protein FOE74_10845 [Rufibacter glacialis]GGK71487.1 hypothetical protein GCM10011405_19580 [Rufibacter glacialis]